MKTYYTIIFILTLFVFESAMYQNNKSVDSLMFEAQIKENVADGLNSKEKISSHVVRKNIKIDSTIRQYNLRDTIIKWFYYKHPNSHDIITDSLRLNNPNQLVDIRELIYYDITGDNKEEAIIGAFSLYSGTGGLDIFKIITKDDTEKLQELFLPKDTNKKHYENLRGKMSFEIKDGKLVQYFPIYNKSDANCCPSAGTRFFTYKWNHKKLILESVKNKD